MIKPLADVNLQEKTIQHAKPVIMLGVGVCAHVDHVKREEIIRAAETLRHYVRHPHKTKGVLGCKIRAPYHSAHLHCARRNVQNCHIRA